MPHDGNSKHQGEYSRVEPLNTKEDAAWWCHLRLKPSNTKEDTTDGATNYKGGCHRVEPLNTKEDATGWATEHQGGCHRVEPLNTKEDTTDGATNYQGGCHRLSHWTPRRMPQVEPLNTKEDAAGWSHTKRMMSRGGAIKASKDGVIEWNIHTPRRVLSQYRSKTGWWGGGLT